jgi:hypothetical protein
MTKKKAKPKNKKAKAEVKQQCTARVKTCSKCKYKFEAGDKTWDCPECGTNRRCKNKAEEPYKVCRMHGAGGGRPPVHGKFTIPTKYADRFNSIRQDPELMSLTMNVAINETRTDELLQQIHDNDTSSVHQDIMAAVRMMEYDILRLGNWLETEEVAKLLPKQGFGNILMGMVMLKEAVEPARVEEKLWRDVNFQLELGRRLNDTERKWATQHDQMIPIAVALEAIRTVMRDALEFIVPPKDRATFAKRIRGYIGGD